MTTIKKMLEKEEQKLRGQIVHLESRSGNYPADSLRISHSNGCVQYYFRENQNMHANETASPENMKNESRYKYKKDRDLAEKISQRDYEKRLLKELKKRYAAVKKTGKVYACTNPEAVLKTFSKDRQQLIRPYVLSKDEYIRKWLDEDYPKKMFTEFTQEIYTVNGERVRSKSEKIIADMLFRYHIPYRYEYPLELTGYGTIHPDFLVLNPETRKEYYWEHLGMMDDEKYVKDALARIEAYEKNDIFPGQELILTGETRTRALNIRVLEKIVQRYFM